MNSRARLLKAGYTEAQFWDMAILGSAVCDQADELKWYLPAGYDDSSSEDSDDGMFLGESHSQHETETTARTKTPILSQILDE